MVSCCYIAVLLMSILAVKISEVRSRKEGTPMAATQRLIGMASDLATLATAGATAFGATQ